MRRLLPVCLLFTACATTGAVDSALKGDLSTLRTRIAEEKMHGELDQGRVVDIAHAVASREIYSGAGPAGALRIHSMRSCARPLLGVLDGRAERLDEGGAEATLVLLASGRLRRAALVETYKDADSAAWRAVAARAATQSIYFTLRRKFFVDPDERVRRAALEAANETPAELDLDLLLEAARLDPDPMARSLAVRSVGTLGGERAARGLRDLWERAEEDVRMSILDAYGAKATFVAGGREALLREAETNHGVSSVAAAGELLRVDSSYRENAIALIVRAIKDGDSDQQRLAIALAPVDNASVVEALKKTTTDADPKLRVVALEKLLGVSAERSRSLAELRKLTKGSAASEDANQALARARDASVAPKFRTDLASKDELRRQAAGRALVALGDYASAAALLGDGSADVRVATACTILAKN
jgi:HEAT repeat protein